MKQQAPPSNGNAPAEKTDLEAILERVAPERRADFLRLRQRLERHGDNDELLAVVSYLDSAVVVMDSVARQAQPEAVSKALNQVVQASRDQATAVARYPRWNYALNTTILILIAVLGGIIGAGVVGGAWYLNHQARTQTAQYYLSRDMKAIGSQLEYRAYANGRIRTATFSNPAKPGQPSWLLERPSFDKEGNVTLTFVAPPPNQ